MADSARYAGRLQAGHAGPRNPPCCFHTCQSHVHHGAHTIRWGHKFPGLGSGCKGVAHGFCHRLEHDVSEAVGSILGCGAEQQAVAPDTPAGRTVQMQARCECLKGWYGLCLHMSCSCYH